MYDDYAIYQDWKTDSTFKISYEVSKDNKITLGEPQQVIATTSYEPVFMGEPIDLETLGEATFSGTNPNDLVYRTGKIFEAGEYPDKGFSLTEDEMDAAIQKFEEAPLDIEHMPTVLDGQLGKLTKVFRGEKAGDLMGTVAMPRWLDEALQKTGRKVSTTWSKLTKEIKGLALVLNPRVPDAALMSDVMSAFTASHTEEGSGKPITIAELEITLSKGENMDPKTQTQTQEPEVDFAAKFAEMQAQIEKTNAENARLRARDRDREAEKLAKEMISSFRALPADEGNLISLFSQALIDDETDSKPAGLATFGVAKTQTNRVTALKVFLTSRPSFEHLTKEGIETKVQDGQILLSRATPPPVDEDGESTEEPDDSRVAELLGHTTFGSEVAASRKG
jgi:hypothetical protein